jgi:TatD DNase family protein
MQLIDSHAHLTSSDVLPRLEDILARAQSAHVHPIVNVCTDAKSLEEGLSLEKRYPWILNAGSTTPHDVDLDGEKDFAVFSQAARAKQIVAIGETGLDYYYQHSDRQTQRQFFIRYLHLALSCQLPVIIHCRDAFDDLFAIMDQEYSQQTAIMHCFTGKLSDAQKAIDRGWMISFSGILTFTKSQQLRDVARSIPSERLLVETDTPYLSPQNQRGRPNEPAFVVETAQCLAEVRGTTLAEISRITTENACRIFRIHR